ncbi:MAG: hypothetical protein L6V93_06670 [Clostridiales bacterium]|nr:MAG: hypothetical protein L6V93_06670 [Clostridiales bacterium]
MLMNLSIDKIELPSLDDLKIEDKWILSKYNKLVKAVSANLEKNLNSALPRQSFTTLSGTITATGISSL